MSIYIALDVDNTIISHCYPNMNGRDLGSILWLLLIQEKFGAIFLLNSMREGPSAQIAIDWLTKRGIRIKAVNTRPGQEQWTKSPKCHADLYIDDRAVGTPLKKDGTIDWYAYGPMLIDAIESWQARQPN